jgi:hypothetical protein
MKLHISAGMKIYQLPVAVFSHFRDYIIDYSCLNTVYLAKQIRSWKNFLSCSKFFVEIKKEQDYYFFRNHCLDVLSILESRNSSNSPIPNEFSRIPSLLRYRIKNSSHQIGLSTQKFYDCVSTFLTVHYFECFCTLSLTNVSFLSHVKYVSLRGCSEIQDISPLSSCYFLDLSDTGQLVNNSNIHLLSKLRILRLNGCDGLSNVSNLQDVYELSLSKCFNVRDVSMLGNCHRLNVSDCRGIEDISSLSYIPYLQIANMGGVKKGLCLDYSVKELSLDGIMLKHMPSLRSNCHILITRELSKPFTELAISVGFYELQNITFIGQNISLRDWKQYRQLTKLSLQNFGSPCKISNLPHLQYLEIINGFNNLFSFAFEFSTCSSLNEIYFENVRICSLSICNNNLIKRITLVNVIIEDQAIHFYQSLERLEVSNPMKNPKLKLILHYSHVSVNHIICDHPNLLETVTVPVTTTVTVSDLI